MYYLVHDTGDDDPTETRQFPYAEVDEAKAQMKHELDRTSGNKKHWKIVDEEGKEVK